jgi:hypothetical protein
VVEKLIDLDRSSGEAPTAHDVFVPPISTVPNLPMARM